MNKKLLGIIILAVLVSLVQLTASTGAVPKVFASKLAGIVGAGSTGVQVQNLDAASGTDITMDLYPQSGAAPVQLIKSALAGGSALFYLPSEGTVADGAYAAIVSAVKPIAAIARTEWPSVGGAATYGTVPPSMNVLVPLATKAYFGWTSQFSVQNTDTAGNANITVKLYQKGSSVPNPQFTDTILPGTSKTYDLGSSSQFSGVAAGFVGSVQITGDKNLAVQAFVDKVGGSKAVYAFSGLDAAAAATTLYAPLVRRGYAGATTGISIVNPNATTVSVHIIFNHNPASPMTGDYTQDITIAANSSEVAYQGTGPMPANWLGSAVLQATGGPIVAMVNDETSTTSAAYNAPSAADGALIVSLPLVRNKHTSNQFTTGVQVMNIGAGTASITINYKTSGGTAFTEGPVSVPPNGSVTWYQPAGPFPVGAYGSATVTSNQSVVAIVNDVCLTGAFDAAIYNGIKAD